jgi:hypothetical protein
LWQNLSKEEKQKYKEAAKHGKLKFWKLTIPISHLLTYALF